MTLYDLIADLRREHPTASASKALDLVTAELGHSRDNLREALAALDGKVPAGGKAVLDELLARAEKAGLDDLDYGPDPYAFTREPLDSGTLGIGALLALSSLLAMALAAMAVVAGLNGIFHFF
ncbi:MAG TPA: hypothetical protein VK131_06930 [Candidatus Acidoferrales bacterium]|nr:hypothetical protein [Candidatus Acidoferrales bacterium]